MLYLEARVHLEEIEVALRVDNEFHRTGRLIVHSFGECDGLLAHLFARRLVEERRRRFFDDLLVATL